MPIGHILRSHLLPSLMLLVYSKLPLCMSRESGLRSTSISLTSFDKSFSLSNCGFLMHPMRTQVGIGRTK